MRSVLWLCLAATLMLFAARAEAVIYQVDPITGYDCAGDMSTTNCFSPPTGTSFSGPTTTACYAKGRDGQRCKSCQPAYSTDGQPMGYNTCNYVSESAACDCVFSTSYGTTGRKCTGNTASSCEYSW